MTSAADWLLQNIGKATRWRGNTPDGGGCAHDCEGGVDIPLPAGTPIYALATGTLIGNGPWKGHGVITTDVPGTGKLYYQHLDVLSSFPQCANGNCNGQVIQAGQLLGYSNADVGEVEVGINPAWGGIWGPPTNGSSWVLDPRGQLMALAQGLGGGSNALAATNATGGCSDAGVSAACCGNCQQFNQFDPRFYACLTQETVCMATSGITNPFTSLLAQLGPWLNPIRLLKMVMGLAGLAIAVLVIFWPQAEQTVVTAGKAAIAAA